MFFENGIFSASDLLDVPGIVHGFSARRGGNSTLAHTASLNLSRNLGDPEDVVLANLDLFARSLSGGCCTGENTVTAHQIHSAKVRLLTEANRGEGYHLPCGEDCDGFVTDVPGILPIVRTADCVPLLFAGRKADLSPVIGAAHAGWRGTATGIAACAVEEMVKLGALRETIRCAVGPHIGFCCYAVGEDFRAAVANEQGEDFARRHIRAGAHGMHADLSGMNLELLEKAGIPAGRVDLHPDCTMCAPDRYYSHRATGGKRGVMGAGILILPAR